MNPETTRNIKNTTFPSYLYMAIELSNAQWKLGFTVGFGQAPRLRSLVARDLGALVDEIRLAKERFGLPENAPVFSCYEAGRDGFWLHRYLQASAITNWVVDSSSIEVNRRSRRVKTDRMDVGKLLIMLIRYHQGEEKVWGIVNIPSPEVEDQRQLHRDLRMLKAERTQHINRIKGLLASQGVQLAVGKNFLSQLEALHLWDGSPLLPGLSSRLVREYERIQLINQYIHQLDRIRVEAVRSSSDPAMKQVRALLRLKGIGMNSAWLYVMEFFSWRNFRNRRELGALAGLTPTPYQSGDSTHEQGISKAGNRHIRAVAIEIAWEWLHFQPDSQLSHWYQERFAKGSSRVRRIGIVALARRLLIALWEYLETGNLPEGACVMNS
jgi:transposase